MAQTKKQLSGRGRPKKSFSSTQKKIEVEQAQNDIIVAVRGRPKKSRKIDDSINTKIGNQKKSIAKIQKENDRISNEIWISNFSTKKIEKSNWTINEIEFEDSKKADKFSLIVLICAMLFFIFALFKTFFLNKDTDNLSIQDLSILNNSIENELENQEIIPELQDNEAEIINEEPSKYLWNNIDIIEWNNLSDEQIILNFYGYMNSLDFDNISSNVDKYLRNSDVFRTYFTQNRLTNFYKKIDDRWLNISNIKLKSWDENTTRYYSYLVTYYIDQKLYQEERETAIVNRNDRELIWSLKCVTTWCSKMPFFQK